VLDGAPANALVLDAGCGTGGFLKQLARRDSFAAFGVELDPDAAATAREKSGRPVAVASVNRLPIASNSLDVIVSADVLCHEGVQVERALGEFRLALKPGGGLIVSLPAYQWLYSAHDRAVGNARRFGKRELVTLLRRAGFAHIAARYWNSLLFPAMAAMRLARRGEAKHSDVAALPEPLERLFGAVAAAETELTKKGLRLPFGGSILAVAIKP